MQDTNCITLRAHAKINLSLEITGRRPDGYHDLRSLMQGVGLHDVIKITKCPQNGTKYNLPHCTIGNVVVYLCTDAKTIPTDMNNLALKGCKAVLDALPAGAFDLIIDLDKRLPVAAGIGGGSGNAAACMLGLNHLLGSPMTLDEMMRVGVRVGADVPFSLMMNAAMNEDVLSLDGGSVSAWARGIGEILDPCEPVIRYIVMANPGIEVSTKTAYEAIDSLKAYSDAEGLPEIFVNDFEEYTLKEYPEALRLRTVMEEELGADAVRMSGSGPTMIAYYEDEEQARLAYSRMREIAGPGTGWKVWFTDTGIISNI